MTFADLDASDAWLDGDDLLISARSSIWGPRDPVPKSHTYVLRRFASLLASFRESAAWTPPDLHNRLEPRP